MSWLSGYKKSSTCAATSEEDIREARRKKLEADRLLRTQQREQTKKKLLAAQASRAEADKALQDLLDIAPDILSGDTDTEVEVSEDILNDNSVAEMVDFDQENENDSATAMDNLRSVQCPFNKEDIEFWFSQLEDQLTLIGVKKQWTKKIALVRFLPPEIQNQVKSLLKLGQTAAGTDIYFRIKKQLLKLYGPKAEDAYLVAKNLVLTDKPSQLGQKLVETICPAEVKLQGCHCDRIVWGLFREKIPIVIRNHLADMAFNKNTYEAIFDKADQVWDSNRGSEPLPNRQVAAVVASQTVQGEVAAVQKNGQTKNKNKNQQQKGQGQSGQGGQGSQSNKNEQKPPKKPAINEDKLCRIHAKWKENATFCAAPWGCRMKNVYRAPQ